VVVSLGIRDKIDLCLGYCLCPGTVVLGPWLPFQEYQNIFIKPRNKQFDNPVFSSVHGAHPSPTRGGVQVSFLIFLKYHGDLTTRSLSPMPI